MPPPRGVAGVGVVGRGGEGTGGADEEQEARSGRHDVTIVDINRSYYSTSRTVDDDVDVAVVMFESRWIAK